MVCKEAEESLQVNKYIRKSVQTVRKCVRKS